MSGLFTIAAQGACLVLLSILMAILEVPMSVRSLGVVCTVSWLAGVAIAIVEVRKETP